MTATAWVSLVSALSALVGTATGITALWNVYKSRRQPLTLGYEIEHRRAFPTDDENGFPSIEVNDLTVDELHHLSLYLRPQGPRDIKRSDFEGPIILELGAPLVALVDQEGFEPDSIKYDSDSQCVRFQPQLLTKHRLFLASFLVGEKPAPKLEVRLADIEPICFDHTEFGRPPIGRTRVAAGVALVGLLLTASGVLGWFVSAQAYQQRNTISNFANDVGIAVTEAQTALAQGADSREVQKELERILSGLGQTSAQLGRGNYDIGNPFSNSYPYYYGGQYWQSPPYSNYVPGPYSGCSGGSTCGYPSGLPPYENPVASAPNAPPPSAQAPPPPGGTPTEAAPRTTVITVTPTPAATP